MGLLIITTWVCFFVLVIGILQEYVFPSIIGPGVPLRERIYASAAYMFLVCVVLIPAVMIFMELTEGHSNVLCD